MSEVRQAQLERLDLGIQDIYLHTPWEVKRAEALWARWEKLMVDEMKEEVATHG